MCTAQIRYAPGWNQRAGKDLIGSAVQHDGIMADNAFSPVVPLAADAIDAMQSAFDRAWTALRCYRKRLSAREACDARIRLAHVIFEQVRAGNHDPDELMNLALSAVAGGTEQAAHPYL
jgi:hypothetical protein